MSSDSDNLIVLIVIGSIIFILFFIVFCVFCCIYGNRCIYCNCCKKDDEIRSVVFVSPDPISVEV